MRKTSRRAPSPSASAAAASSAFTFSGPTASGATTGILPAASAPRICLGRHGSGSPTQPSGGTGHGVEAGLVAEHGDGDVAERGAEAGVHLCHRLAHDLEPGARRAAPAVHELDRDAAPVHLLGDLRAGAVHDDELVALLAQAEDPVDGLGGDRAADLDDEPRHERYSALIRT